METLYYEFDLCKIGRNYLDLVKAINPKRMFYAVKANGEIPLLKKLDSIGASFEIASRGELQKLRLLGVESNRIICSTPIKSEDTIVNLYENGIGYFVFDNLDEFSKIKKLAPKSLKILRINLTNSIPDTIRFGMDYQDFVSLLSAGALNAQEVDGITFYLTKNRDTKRLELALNLAEQFLRLLKKPAILNIGGNYRLPDELNDDYYSVLQNQLFRLKQQFDCIVYAEPGRSIVKSAGCLVCQVIGYKPKEGFVYLDAGLPSGISYKPNRILNMSTTSSCSLEFHKYVFFDSTCSHAELFSDELPFDINLGDRLVFENFGSYSICKANEFHGWEKPFCVFHDTLVQNAF